jgi:hypothetical protein
MLSRALLTALTCILLTLPVKGISAKLSLDEVKSKLELISESAPHNLCVQQRQLTACVDLIVGNDRDVYFNEIITDLDHDKKIELSNYLIEYVLKNKEILEDERLDERERRSLHAIHKKSYKYGLIERIPKRLRDMVYSFNIKSSNFFHYIATPRHKRDKRILVKAATQKDNEPNEKYGKLITRTYYDDIVDHINKLPTFFDNVLAQCRLCDRKRYYSEFHNLPGYGQKVLADSPLTSVEYKYIFKPSIEAGWIDAFLTSSYQAMLVTNVKEIPRFVEEVLAPCDQCNEMKNYRKLLKTPGFGSNARDFFASIEYNYVIKHFPYHEVAAHYFDYAVSYESDLPAFFDSVLAKCNMNCPILAYYKKALNLTELDLTLDLASFTERTIFRYVVKNLQYSVKAYSTNKTLNIYLSVDGHRFNKRFDGKCAFNYATSSRDSATFFQALRGASEAINHYDVYQCELPQADISLIERFVQTVRAPHELSEIKSHTKWVHSVFTYDELIYPTRPKRSANAYSDYSDSSPPHSPSNSTSSDSNTSKTSHGPAREVEKIRNNGRISGVPSYLIECSGGSDHVIYHKDGTWYHGSWGHMGNKFDSWDKEEIGKELCL